VDVIETLLAQVPVVGVATRRPGSR